MDVLQVLGVIFLLTLLWLLYKIVKILLSDADLTLSSCSLRRKYFQDKIILVTGASGGIGSCLCQQLSILGSQLVLSAPQSELGRLQEVKNGMANPESAKIVTLDLCDAESIHEVAKESTQAFGHIDILIHAAGVGQLGFFADVSEEVNKLIMDINYTGPRALTRALLPDMLDRKSGHIVGISSFAGKVGSPFSTSYSASKFALFGLLEGVRTELLGKGVAVTTVCPGPVSSNLIPDSRVAGGEKRLKSCDLGDDIYKMTNAHAISPERCAELILVATSNLLEEAWIGKWSFLILFYLSKYVLSVSTLSKYSSLAKRFEGKMKKLY